MWGQAFPFDLEGSTQVQEMSFFRAAWAFSRIMPPFLHAMERLIPTVVHASILGASRTFPNHFLGLFLIKNAQTLPLALGILVITLYCGDAR